MPPRTKRQRKNTDVLVPKAQLTPHDTIWLEDGSIVLATDVHVFRVHKSILAKNSSVFKNMLNFPTGGDELEGGVNDDAADAEQWDGLPLVRMVHDNDEDVCHLLMALYDRQ